MLKYGKIRGDGLFFTDCQKERDNFLELSKGREEKTSMTRKLVIVWLTLFMMLFSSISVYAEENFVNENYIDQNVQGDFFEKHVIINGKEIINYNLQYPFFLYNNTTYFPLSPEMGQICGFYAEMDWDSRTLKLLKTKPTREDISTNWMKNNNENVSLTVISEATVLAFTEAYEETDENQQDEGELSSGDEGKAADISDISLEDEGTEQGDEQQEASADVIGDDVDRFSAPELTVAEIELEEAPVLACGKYIFLPVKAMTSQEHFNWDIYYNGYYGLCISTKEGVSAESFCDKAEELLNTGLVNYMKGQNSSISTSVGQQYLFLFKRASDVYGVDTRLLMAIASKESHFGIWSTSRAGARGIMQIMPDTGARFGLTAESLYDAKTNIDFGAMYISQRIVAYNGDWTKGLSAYNQGSAKVNRGTHSTIYATRVIGEYDRIGNFLTMSGYVAP